MIHRIKSPEFLIPEILALYPPRARRSPENTPFHLSGYTSGMRPLTWTGGLYPESGRLGGEEALLLDRSEMIGAGRSAIWNPVWRLWDIFDTSGNLVIPDTLWQDHGRTVTPQEAGVPENLHQKCSLDALTFEKLVSEARNRKTCADAG